MTAAPEGTPRGTGTPVSARLQATVWALGFVSLFMDVSSEIVHSLLPVFLVSVLGAGIETVGLIEGVAEATAMSTRVFSGALSDQLGRRKALAVFGYGLGALSKPLFALAPGIGLVFTARFVDRIGKGVRGAPREALVADVTPPAQRGAAFGLRRPDAGVRRPLPPGLLAGLHPRAGGGAHPGAQGQGTRRSGRPRPTAHRPSGPGASRPALLAGGAGRRRLHPGPLQRGLSAAARAKLGVAGGPCATGPGRHEPRLQPDRLPGRPAVRPDRPPRPAGARAAAGAGVVAAGGLRRRRALGSAHGADPGADFRAGGRRRGPRLRGTAFGIFGLVTGLALLGASVLAGWLWQSFGAPVTFYGGTVVAGLALAGFLALPRDAGDSGRSEA